MSLLGAIGAAAAAVVRGLLPKRRSQMPKSQRFWQQDGTCMY